MDVEERGPVAKTTFFFAGLPLLCIIVNANGRSKKGRLWTQASYFHYLACPLTPKFYSFQTTFSTSMSIFIFVRALTPKLNLSVLAAIMSGLVTLNHAYSLTNLLSQHSQPANAHSGLKSPYQK